MIAFFDPVSGISGDMALGALLDAGLRLEQLQAALSGLAVAGYHLEVARAEQHGLSGSRVTVALDETDQPHRHLSDITAILDNSDLPARVRERALAVFKRLANAEAHVHGTTPEEVHFHEVGAVDSIVDIVGVVAGLDLLGVDQCYCGPLPLPLHGGLGNSAHGPIPLPGPATLEILSAVNAPFINKNTDRELVTPTGAALVAELCRFEQPPMSLRRVGVGFGSRELPWPNVLRVLLCDPAKDTANVDIDTIAEQQRLERDSALLFETNIDDLNPQVYGYLTEQLLKIGALDVWLTPIQMKKGRPGVLLSVLVYSKQAAPVVDLLLAETTTLGLRCTTVERIKAPRRMLQVDTKVGPIAVKARRLDGRWLAQPEYEDCAKAARQNLAPLREVMQMALDAANRLLQQEELDARA